MPRYYRNMFNAFFSPPPAKKEEAKTTFFAYINGQQAGPMSEKEMKQLVAQGLVGPDTMVWTRGLPQWTRAAAVPSIYKLLLLSSSASAKSSAPAPAAPVEPAVDKAKREDILSALTALGFRKQAFGSVVDELLTRQPDISVEEAIVLLIKTKQ